MSFVSQPNPNTTHIPSNMECSIAPQAVTNMHLPTFNSTSFVQNNISSLAQDSLSEIQRLRLLLTNLLTSVQSDENDPEEQNKVMDENFILFNKSASTKCGNIPSPVCTTGEGKATGITPEGRNFNPPTDDAKSTSGDKLTIHKLVNRISEVFNNLDQLASRMQANRLSSRPSDQGLQNALSLFNTVEQLEFSRNSWPYESSLSQYIGTDDHGKDSDMRRVDWLMDRIEAERWSHRYWGRTRTVLEGLLACSAFRRSHLNTDHSRRRTDFLNIINRDYRADMEHLFTELNVNLPDLTITLIEPLSVVSVAHLRVGEVFQCYVTFRQLNPERIIVRGISEPMIIKTCSDISNGSLNMEEKPLSVAGEELLSDSSLDSLPKIRDIIVSLLSPDLKSRSLPDNRQQRSSKLIRFCTIHQQKLDLFTPSRHPLFRRITSLAQCALLHFSNEYKPPSAIRGFFAWLHSYRDLFSAPCCRCGQLLGQNVELPIWRSYPQLRKDDSRSMEPQHEHCQAIL
ncbi:Mediator of RNA polymerase II transcription subunit 27 [Schistosoma japonicum]|uniref:Mediator of RNA polymerase II transcription subunit 27 n=1 Tax=Schistosoma japonicum TaxID=6182 RepID=A0A4Z2D5Y4_SCHJA|nr:Mediator of RNA polymerase II transcription subunit 27-B [Schistosoma japonicum]KAH8851701.1 Mediator of RNA polymerase II transcription subunit 27-B [Schistosoma japonicum]TNN11892.1 Mediator of RNA polymerase II transcription subunit 27 [Schistosoma japonicum]